MKAAVFHSTTSQPPYVQLEDLPSPTPSTGDVVVKVLAARVVSYVSEIFSGRRPYPTLLPLVPGASAVGVITAVGPGLTSYAPGQLVYCDPTIRARDAPLWSPLMLQGLIAAGPEAQKMQAVWRNGGWAEEMLVPAESVVPIPPSIKLTPAQLTSLSPVSVAFGGLSEAGFTAGSTIGVTGATGLFGSAAVAVALAMGARRVIPCGRNKAALDKFVDIYGTRVHPVVLSGDEAEDATGIQSAAGDGFFIDFIFDILPPEAPFSIVRSAVRALRGGGTLILMGGETGNVEIPYFDFLAKGITVKGVFMCQRKAFHQLIGLVDAGLLDLGKWSITEFPLAQINEAIVFAKENPGAFSGVVITTQGTD
ncbi:hypothetical protein JAAARDRAFT_30521 [Jaapia argillacea MUCL 33604]|uniref:Enoyl reductase (ER) domain-containing protein n=1 Tax=Jaapia argillacea MUCL 33604 TaxID=933084 RepID=A0A067Q6D1_9AGAM|nr:hypothetical protein JAAARDRAFT_30521 [Jaapia argillacea MUCL 33604]